MKAHIKVGICVPSGPEWDADFSLSLVDLYAHVLTRPMQGVRQIKLMMINERGSLLPRIRQGLVEKALARECDYILFVDTDQVFPSNLLYRLLRHEKKVVACNIATKSIPANPTARNFNPEYFGGDKVYSDDKSPSLEKVWRVGTGVMLIDASVFRKLPKPWFSVRYLEEHDEFVGEDWFFCEQLEKMGTEIYVDHELSKEVFHVGPLRFGHELVGEVVQVPVEEAAS